MKPRHPSDHGLTYEELSVAGEEMMQNPPPGPAALADRINQADTGSDEFKRALQEVWEMGPCLEIVFIWSMVTKSDTSRSDSDYVARTLAIHKVLCNTVLEVFRRCVKSR